MDRNNNNPNHQKKWRTWLWILWFMTIGAVALGGITRLTNAGLAITEWAPLHGVIPPLTHDDWQRAFQAYAQTPQKKYLFPNMTLAQFKTLFWIEYIHRLWARLLGLVALLGPILIGIHHLSRKQIFVWLCTILLLGIQAWLGWKMVQSGLKGPYLWVDPRFLLIHHLFALGVFSWIGWLLAHWTNITEHVGKTQHTAWLILWLLLLIQFALGTLLAGWRGAYVAPTYPLMNGAWIPQGIWRTDLNLWENLLQNVTLIHFLHRHLPIAILPVVIWLTLREQTRARTILLLLFLLQFALGVSILLLTGKLGRIPISTALSHQLLGWLLYSLAWWGFLGSTSFQTMKPKPS